LPGDTGNGKNLSHFVGKSVSKNNLKAIFATDPHRQIQTLIFARRTLSGQKPSALTRTKRLSQKIQKMEIFLVPEGPDGLTGGKVAASRPVVVGGKRRI
jgi:hypothetical protein